MLGFLRVSFVKLCGKPRDLAAGRVAMQLAFGRGLIERANRGAQFLLCRAGFIAADCFRCGLDGGPDLRPRGAVMFSALEVLPVALLC